MSVSLKFIKGLVECDRKCLGKFLNPNSRGSDSGGLEWGLNICISNKFPDDATVDGHWLKLPFDDTAGKCHEIPTTSV